MFISQEKTISDYPDFKLSKLKMAENRKIAFDFITR
jgi:hypothetical protein